MTPGLPFEPLSEEAEGVGKARKTRESSCKNISNSFPGMAMGFNKIKEVVQKWFTYLHLSLVHLN